MEKGLRQIIAMGGGGFSMEPENPALDLFVLSRARNRKPSICFLATATGDSDGYIEKFYDAFRVHHCRPTHVPLFRRTPDLEQTLLNQDVIYVGGGNTKSMLAVWREWDVPRLLRRAWSTGDGARRDQCGGDLLVQDGSHRFVGRPPERLTVFGVPAWYMLSALRR